MNPITPTNHRRIGFTFLDLLIVIVICLFLAAFLLPLVAGRSKPSERIRCVINLKQIGTAHRLWAFDHNEQNPATVSVTNGGVMELAMTGDATAVFNVLSNELSTPLFLFCPSERSNQRRVAPAFGSSLTKSNLTYFIGIDPAETVPTMLLAGDDNLTIGSSNLSSGLITLQTNPLIAWTAARHQLAGNLVLADGSVQQLTSTGLQRQLALTGVATNRLILP